MYDNQQINQKLSELNREAEERESKKRAEKLNLQYIDARKIPVSIDALSLIPEEQALQAKAAIVEKKLQNIALICYNPNLKETQELIENLKQQGLNPKIFIVSLSGLNEIFKYYKFIIQKKSKITGKVEIAQSSLEKLIEEINNLITFKKYLEKINFSLTSVTELFQLILAGAIANKSSDIHFEAQEDGARLRFRIDGVLNDICKIPLKNYEPLISRIKLVSGLKINIHEETQDGRFTINLTGKEIEMRVSIIPSEFGETIVMRILDPEAIMVDFDQLGIREDDLKILERNIKKPNGMILNTGPTGSGKTTTLYTILRKLNTPDVKIITIEDPIEYKIEGIEQTQVDPEANYTFASGLRAVVRQDPDIILVGEIRDQETADIAMQAALTGHLVLSTLHTNDSIGAIPRLIDLGSKPQTIGPALSLVIAQRLVRKLCNNCKQKENISQELKIRIENFLNKIPSRINKNLYKEINIYKPVGCEKCNNIGYKGRIGIFEFFEMNPELQKIIITDSSWLSIKTIADQNQMTSMQQDGILKTLIGITTFDEVENVTGPINWS
ncbi:MAG: GspE/PulE family protein [Patescibacteria group bacterium]|nr:GspE/PulE family protein [Patescibacteria group bacterium]MDW8279625.1 GspE/PulE family protein [bacterium]